MQARPRDSSETRALDWKWGKKLKPSPPTNKVGTGVLARGGTRRGADSGWGLWRMSARLPGQAPRAGPRAAPGQRQGSARATPGPQGQQAHATGTYTFAQTVGDSKIPRTRSGADPCLARSQ